jgi:hypothetical protein
VVSALCGKVGDKEFGLLVTLGTFTTPAENFARGKTNLRLIDGDELVDLILDHYEQFDSRHKAILPLKRVYVPEVVDEFRRVVLITAVLHSDSRAGHFRRHESPAVLRAIAALAAL